ncbi:MAG TPA: hypothetical protein VFN77_02750 [Acetobacteraceae bacterium]|nr:hypothetical protein [Acetobacteraceae bacterium]
MKRLVFCCLASLALYWAGFAWVLDRPLSLGLLRVEMQQKLARGARLPSPKLVILAGSNAPYSHSCAVIGAMLRLPCENAGVAVGIGLDDLFARWTPLLHRGDILYLPMEVQQYTVSRAENRMNVDGGMLFRHDPRLLARLGPGRLLGGAFANTLPDGLEALAEMTVHRLGLGHPRALLAAEFDPQGDRIGTTAATADPAFLAKLRRIEPPAAAITSGYGTRLIAAFVREEIRHGIIVIGGLPTDFRNVRLPHADLAALRSVYRRQGGQFLQLPNLSRYPRADFYDSEDHLMQPCQYRHSILIARAMGAMLKRPVLPPSPAMRDLAATCPGGTPAARTVAFAGPG